MNKETIGYIAGVFDLFHIGHLNLLRNAKSKCGHLIVGVLTDELAIHFKKKPPYIPENERKEIVDSIQYVDETVFVDFGNISKIKAWELYHFDLLFSGDDYRNVQSWIDDRKKLNAVGADIHFFEYTASTSSTKIKTALQPNDKSSNKRLLIFGAGEQGKRLLKKLENEGFEAPYAFVDNNSDLANTSINSIPVLSFDQMLSLFADYRVLIACKNHKDITKQLIESGISDFEVISQ